MNFAERRKQVFEKMERQSALILFSGIESHVSADEYAPFEADRNFFYLTGLRRDHMILLMKKTLTARLPCLSFTEMNCWTMYTAKRERYPVWTICSIRLKRII